MVKRIATWGAVLLLVSVMAAITPTGASALVADDQREDCGTFENPCRDFSIRGVNKNGDEDVIRCGVIGTEGDDILMGTDFSDTICGLGGNDVIFGLGGDDRLFGGPGDDVIYGGEGGDLITTGTGDDVAYGGEGNDRIMVSFEALDEDVGADRLIGGPGDDELAAGWPTGANPADDSYRPLASAGMTLIGGPGVDLLIGSQGDDRMYLGGAGGLARGWGGDDLLVGASGTVKTVSEIYCRSSEAALGEFDIAQTKAVNVLLGNLGDDVLVSGGGQSCMAGSEGSDTFYGSSFDDSIFAGADQFNLGSVPRDGGAPEDRDRIFAKGGNDVIFGSLGSDTVYGSDGNDTFSTLSTVQPDSRDPVDNQPDRINLGPGDDIIRGGGGDDRLNGGDGTDDIDGGGGDDYLWPGRDEQPDALRGGEGDDQCFRFAGDVTDSSCESTQSPGTLGNR